MTFDEWWNELDHPGVMNIWDARAGWDAAIRFGSVTVAPIMSRYGVPDSITPPPEPVVQPQAPAEKDHTPDTPMRRFAKALRRRKTPKTDT